ncbi:hypothetical protein D3C77_546040 [compost metagenome]
MARKKTHDLLVTGREVFLLFLSKAPKTANEPIIKVKWNSQLVIKVLFTEEIIVIRSSLIFSKAHNILNRHNPDNWLLRITQMAKHVMTMVNIDVTVTRMLYFINSNGVS